MTADPTRELTGAPTPSVSASGAGVDERASVPAVGSASSATPPGQGAEHQATVPAVGPVVEELAKLDELPVEEHPAVYEHVHDRLQAAMTDSDEGA